MYYIYFKNFSPTPCISLLFVVFFQRNILSSHFSRLFRPFLSKHHRIFGTLALWGNWNISNDFNKGKHGHFRIDWFLPINFRLYEIFFASTCDLLRKHLLSVSPIHFLLQGDRSTLAPTPVKPVDNHAASRLPASPRRSPPPPRRLSQSPMSLPPSTRKSPPSPSFVKPKLLRAQTLSS